MARAFALRRNHSPVAAQRRTPWLPLGVLGVLGVLGGEKTQARGPEVGPHGFFAAFALFASFAVQIPVAGLIHRKGRQGRKEVGDDAKARGRMARMKISFEVGVIPAEYERNWFSGRAVLRAEGKTQVIQSPWNPLTHVSVVTTRRWVRQLGGHDVVIEKTRPWLMAAARPHRFRIFVDGRIVAERTGF